MSFFRKKKNNLKPGISLIEVLVATSLFVIILLSMTQIFQMIIESQRRAVASQNLQENIKYFFEVISKEIRMAQKNDGSCTNIPVGSRFALGSSTYGQVLYLKNYHGQCVSYYLANDNGIRRFKVDRGTDSDYLSPQAIHIDYLQFEVHENLTSQAYVTIGLGASVFNTRGVISNLIIQTSITSRYYKAN